MKITLMIDNKEKTFLAPFISARRLRKAMALLKYLNDFNEESMDKLGEFMVELYGEKFTIDELYDGMAANEFFSKVLEDFNSIIGEFKDKIKN